MQEICPGGVGGRRHCVGLQSVGRGREVAARPCLVGIAHL